MEGCIVPKIIDDSFNVNGEPSICLNEDLDQIMSLKDLEKVTRMWNFGFDFWAIGKRLRRDPDEIFLALFHQGRRNKLDRSVFEVLGHIVLKEIKGSHLIANPKAG